MTASGSLTQQLAGWASTLQLSDVPDRVVSHARVQVLSQLGSIRAGLRHPFGRKVVAAFGPPGQPDPRQAAFVLAALSVGLDFDDTAYAGHLSHSTVNVPLAYAASLRLTGTELLTAVIAANETAGRITASATIGPFRGQTATHTHLAGAVAARLRAQRAPAAEWVSAWGLSLALPPWPIERGFYGSDAKIFVASSPVRWALDACDAAHHGLVGAPDVLEHPQGFLARFSDVPLPEAVVAGLGERWHTETFSLKVHPGSAYLSAAVECAIELHHQLGPVRPDRIADVVVTGSVFTAQLEHGTAGMVIGPESPLSALNFSLGYNLATALLTGDLEPADFTRPRLAEPARWELAAKVRAVHDPDRSREAMRATAPIGAALRQAGPRAEAWVRERVGPALAAELGDLGPPETTFEGATKRLGVDVTVHLTDGTRVSSSTPAATGSIGWGEPGERVALMAAKFARTGGDPWISDAVQVLETLTGPEVAELLGRALAGSPDQESRGDAE